MLHQILLVNIVYIVLTLFIKNLCYCVDINLPNIEKQITDKHTMTEMENFVNHDTMNSKYNIVHWQMHIQVNVKYLVILPAG